MEAHLLRRRDVAPDAHVLREVGIEYGAICSSSLREPRYTGSIESYPIYVRADRAAAGRREITHTIRFVHAVERAHFPSAGGDLLHHLAGSAVAIQVLEAAARAEPQEGSVLQPDRTPVFIDPGWRRLAKQSPGAAV